MQGDFLHWVPLINHFEDWFEKHVSKRWELKLAGGKNTDDAAQFPIADCLAILRVSCILLENTTNKHLYQSYDVRRDRSKLASMQT